MYILIKDPDTPHPELVIDAAGLLQWFASLEEAHQYALTHQLEPYEVYALSKEEK
ncbi:hypothetical protein ACFQ4C_25785 [Larkinella insperata]|uniref:Uncharacterized protein n=1 Tax=Larkinella insperata TaxID=332158 RepID=A0ABW3QJ76_9BACT